MGHVLLSVNGSPVAGRTTEEGRDVFEVVETKVSNNIVSKIGLRRMKLVSLPKPTSHINRVPDLDLNTFCYYCFVKKNV